MTDPIKLKIQSLCPDVINKHGWCGINCGLSRHCWEEIGSPITLAVVLRAIGAAYPDKPPYPPKEYYSVDMWGNFVDQYESSKAKWNLTKDNYDEQPEETKKFIGSLLGV